MALSKAVLISVGCASIGVVGIELKRGEVSGHMPKALQRVAEESLKTMKQYVKMKADVFDHDKVEEFWQNLNEVKSNLAIVAKVNLPNEFNEPKGSKDVPAQPDEDYLNELREHASVLVGVCEIIVKNKVKNELKNQLNDLKENLTDPENNNPNDAAFGKLVANLLTDAAEGIKAPQKESGFVQMITANAIKNEDTKGQIIAIAMGEALLSFLLGVAFVIGAIFFPPAVIGAYVFLANFGLACVGCIGAICFMR